MSNKHVEDVGFGDERVEVSNFVRYKGVKGQTDRIAFLSSNVKRVFTHYHNDQYFRCLSTEAKTGICCQNLKSPDQRFGVVIFHYTTDPQGDLVDESKLQGSIKIWPFSETKYTDLTGFNRKFLLLTKDFDTEQFDMEILCTDDNFQKMTFTPCREAHWKKNQKWFDQLILKEVKASERMSKMMGKDLTEDEVRVILELNKVSSMSEIQPQGEDIDIDDLLPPGDDSEIPL